MPTLPDLPTLTAVVDRIIPADDFPSASQAGVLTYLARVLAADRAAFLPQLADFLTTLDAATRDAQGRLFPALPPEQQDALLAAHEAAPAFRTLVDLVMEGYYADPGNGGNAGAAAWKMVGYKP